MAITLNPSYPSSALSAGLQGVQNGIGIANQAASDIARAGIEGADLNLGDLASSLVELKIGEQLAKASAAVVRSADESLGALIDIRV